MSPLALSEYELTETHPGDKYPKKN